MLKQYIRICVSKFRYISNPIELVKKISHLWTNFSLRSVNHSILTATAVVGIMTALGKLISVIKELVVAWRFGLSDDLDAFFIALIVPSFLVTVIGNSFNTALIPTYIQVREQQGMKAAQKLFSGAMVFSLILLLLVTIVMGVTAPFFLPLIASGFNRAKLGLTVDLLVNISPWLILTGSITIIRGVLNAGERFALAAFSPAITPTITILLLLVNPSWGVNALTFGLICGAFLELILLGMALKGQGIYLLPKWSGFNEDLRQVIGQYMPMIAGACLMSSTNIVDQSMAATLSSGSVTALNYGNKLIALPITLIVTALGTSVTPYFAKMVANEDWKQIQDTFKRYLKWIFLFTIPLTGFIIIISEPLVRIMFQRGSFTAEDTQIVSKIQACYALQIPFSIGGILVVRLISSLKANHILMKAAIWNLLLNIILNFIFMKWIGVSGIALSTSFVMLYSYTYVTRHSSKLIKQTQAN